jgi:hypothetical protein
VFPRRTLAAGYGAEQPVRLAVDPVSEVEGIGTAVVAADPELDRPKAARVHAAGADRKRPVKFPADRVEGVDLAVTKAEVADQQMTAKPADTVQSMLVVNPWPRRSARPAGRNRANHFRPKYSVILSQAPTALACRGLELDQLAEASRVRRQAPGFDSVADWRQRRHVCGLPH